MQNFPLVSFVIPTHNRAAVLKDCLESVVNQTYNNLEVLVIDDNSTDNTLEILEAYKSKYSFFKYFKNTGNGGNAARNLGIELAKGDYIAFMDDDDICELYRIEKQMKAVFESNYEYNFIVSGFTVFNSTGKTTEVIDYLKPMQSLGFTVRWLVKKKLLTETGGFDLEQPALQDVEFFWRLKKKAKIFFIKEPLIKVRDSQISITKDQNKMIRAIIRLLDLHSDKMSKREKNLWLITLCKKYSYINDWNNYKLSLKKLNKSNTPLTSIFLLVTLFTKKNKLLKFHSRLYHKYEKTLSKYLSISSCIENGIK